MAFNLPVVIGSAGLQPQDLGSLNSQLLALVGAAQPGYTGNLPGSMIEDIASTDTLAISLCDQARVDLVNSLSPNTVNQALVQQLGAALGLTMGSVTNASVLVVFSGTVGYVIPQGLLVSDTSGQVYQLDTGGVIASSGSSASLSATAVSSASLAPEASTVTTLVTSTPSGITLSVTNPTAGTAPQAAETYESYMARIQQAMLAATVGGPRYLKTLLGNISGVAKNWIGVQQVSTTGLRVIVGGGDAYEVAYAILCAIDDPSRLQGSAVSSTRDVTVSLTDSPDTYSVKFVSPPSQTVTLSITWNTTQANFTGGAAFQGLVQPVLADYINGIGIGQPINVLEINTLFAQAVAPLLDSSLLTTLDVSVYINSTLTAPTTGTYAVSGDAEGYFTCAQSGITVSQG